MSCPPVLDASSHLYKRVCPSVRRSVGPSGTPSLKRVRGASDAEYSALFLFRLLHHLLHELSQFIENPIKLPKIPCQSCELCFLFQTDEEVIRRHYHFFFFNANTSIRGCVCRSVRPSVRRTAAQVRPERFLSDACEAHLMPSIRPYFTNEGQRYDVFASFY